MRESSFLLFWSVLLSYSVKDFLEPVFRMHLDILHVGYAYGFHDVYIFFVISELWIMKGIKTLVEQK